MLGKAPYPSLNQFVNTLKGFNMIENEEYMPQPNHNIAFFKQRGRGVGNSSQRDRGLNKNFSSRERGFKTSGQGKNNQNTQEITQRGISIIQHLRHVNFMVS